MRKKIALTVIFMCSVFTAVYAQEFKSKRYYNAELDEFGYASIGFLSKTPPSREWLKEISSEEGKIVAQKLSNMTLWLCERALDEYDFKEGETYMVICRSDSVQYSHTTVILTITDQDGSFRWWAFIENEK